MINQDTRGRPAARQQAGPGRRKRDPPPPPLKRKPRRIRPQNQTSPPYPTKNNKNSRRAKGRTNKKRYTRHNKQLRILLQQNIAGFRTRKVELLKRLSDLKIDAAAIQEVNFPVRTVKGQTVHEIPAVKGWNIIAQERKTGRKIGTNSLGRGGVAWMIREGINYQILNTRPVPTNDITTEYVGIRIFQEENNKVVGHVDLWNMYVPPIQPSRKDDDRQQNFNTTNLPTTPETFIFADSNCHGMWDDKINTNKMADDWDDWMAGSDFHFMNTLDSYTRTDCKGRKSSPDITLAHNSWIGRYSWNPQYHCPGGSDHIPLLVTLNLRPNNTGRRSRKRKKRGNAKWAYKKANWDLYKTYLDEELEKWPAENDQWGIKKLSTRLTSSIQKIVSLKAIA